MTQILLALIVVSNLVVVFTKASASAARVNEIFETSSSIIESNNEFILDSINGAYEEVIDLNTANKIQLTHTNNDLSKSINNLIPKIEFKNVSFSYEASEKYSTENISFKIYPKETIGIIGGTGSGKSTLVNLLMRFYEVNSGTIKIDGTSINNITKDSLRNLFGMVLQETWLYSGTIRDNISYGKRDATNEEILDAAKKAKAHNFIMKLPNGYDTLVSEGGSNMSVGQKQLLCIARIMLVNPPMLILDEATSSIDTRTEINIQDAFNKIMVGRTSFLIAHRLSTIRQADIILVLKDGQIIDQGNHHELISQKGLYGDLYNSQFAVN